MPDTTPRGYRSPRVGEPAGPVNFRDLALDVDSDVGGLATRLARIEPHQGLQRRAWTAKTEADRTTDGESVYDWPAATNTGGWQDPPGASFTANVIGGHLYEVKTSFSATGGNTTTKRILRASIFVGITEVEETEAHMNGDLIPVEFGAEFRAAASGTLQIRTRVAVNGTMRILRYYQSPATRVLDHGYRSA